MTQIDTLATQEVMVIESRRRRRDDEPTLRDDATLTDVHEATDEEQPCARTST